MINIDPALKTIYKNDRFQMSDVAHPKDMEASFTSIGLIVARDQFADDKGEFELSEGICRDSDLKFGKCNSAQVKFTVADVTDDIAGKEFYLKQTVDDTYDMPFGYFTVDTCPKQDDLRFKDITAYDRMRKVNTDVAAWYKSLALPMSLAAFRASFLAFVGLTEDISNLPLPNDSMAVERTVEAAQLPGQEVIERIEEINGVFGTINTEGKFAHVILKPVYGLYPSKALYPSSSLYPVAETATSYTQLDLSDDTVTVAMREGIRFEEYTVPEIDKLIIRGEEDDIGAIVGTGSNAYIIEGNFLVFGKSSAELEVIARNAFGHIAKRPYRPFECNQIGLPYVKPGDMLRFEQDDPVVGYVLNRTLKGVQALRDEYSSPGSQKRTQNTSQNTEIVKLKYKTTKIKKDVDGVKIEVSDIEAATSAQFEITDQRILQEVTRATQAEGTLSGQISVTAEQILQEVTRATDQEGFLLGQIDVLAGVITLKVSANEVVTAINLSPEAATIKSNKINFNGYATFDVNGNLTTIDGSVLKTGTVVADTVNTNWVYAGNIRADQITAGTFSGDRINGGTISGTRIVNSPEIYTSSITVQGTSSTTTIYGPSIETQYLTAQNIFTPYINSYTPLTSGNYDSIIHTSNITPDTTSSGNIDFSGSINAASTDWCQATFEPKSPSDFRLKKDILTFDLPISLFMELKPKTYRFKCEGYGKGITYGLIAQEVRSAFKRYGYEPDQLNILEHVNVRNYTDECMYVDDKVDRINYTNLIPWLIDVVQQICNKLEMH